VDFVKPLPSSLFSATALFSPYLSLAQEFFFPEAKARCKWKMLSQAKNARCKAGKIFWCLGMPGLDHSPTSPLCSPWASSTPDPMAGSLQHCSPGERLRTRVLARLLVTSLPPGHSSSSTYPLQHINPCLNLESFQYKIARSE